MPFCWVTLIWPPSSSAITPACIADLQSSEVWKAEAIRSQSSEDQSDKLLMLSLPSQWYTGVTAHKIQQRLERNKRQRGRKNNNLWKKKHKTQSFPKVTFKKKNNKKEKVGNLLMKRCCKILTEQVLCHSLGKQSQRQGNSSLQRENDNYLRTDLPEGSPICYCSLGLESWHALGDLAICWLAASGF